jgi:ABC-type transporter MlaC component
MARIRILVQAALISAAVAFSGVALADSPQEDFVRGKTERITELLKAHKDGEANTVLDDLIDYDELTRRAFGDPCPANEPSCHNHWADLSDAQKTEVGGLLKQLMRKHTRKSIQKTLNYDVTYKGVRDAGNDQRVRTEAKAKDKPREPAVQVDYVVHSNDGSYRVVDIFTEGSSTTKNYYDQFKKMLTTSDQGYPYLVNKLKERIGKN